MIVLGVTGPKHDPAAALFVDGTLVAAAEEERFVRQKHAVKHAPVHAARYCLREAGMAPDQVDHVAYPWSLATWLGNRNRQWRNTVSRQPWRSTATWWKTKSRFDRLRDRVARALPEITAPWSYVPHHVAHAASAHLLSGFDECAVLTCDGLGEYVTSRLADGARTLREDHMPHSLGCFYSAMTEFLGWRFNNGEYKLMGMAPYGSARPQTLADVAWVGDDGRFRANPAFVWPVRRARHRGKRYTAALVERLGKPREGDGLDAPYPDIAATTQRVLEQAVHAMLDGELKPVLERTRRLAFAGGCALNVALNRTLLERDDLDELFVQPAANDAGTAIGAAAWVSASLGCKPRPQHHTYLGPSFCDEAIQEAVRAAGRTAERRDDAPEHAALQLSRGDVVGWFDGRMEFGPRALGHRSILGHPGRAGTARHINERIKLREPWRPFCPSILDRAAASILGTQHPAPFMTIAFTVNPEWRARLSEVVHVDGTARPQVVTAHANPRYYRLIEAFEKHTGLPVVLNTSLNQRGDPMACEPKDALALLEGSALDHLYLGPYYVRGSAR